MPEGLFHPDRFYRPREVVTLAHAPRDMVYDALRSGDLPALRRGNRYLIPGATAAAWMATLIHQEAS